MRKKTLLIICFVLSLLIPMSIFGWGYATHAYFANHLGKNGYYLNLQEMYGSMAPDMFNPFSGSSYFNYLRLQSHEQFDKVVNQARTKGLKAFAYGFASHNDILGADFTAHHDGRTTPGTGYVIERIDSLAPAFQDSIEQVLLDSDVDSVQAGEISAEFAPLVAHGVVEVAVDILVRRSEDSKIGNRILQAAQIHSPVILPLLVAAYAVDFSKEFGLKIVVATATIVGAEKAFKEFISFYGYIFTKKESEIIRRLSVYGAELAELYLKSVKGLDIDVSSKVVANLFALAISHVESSYAAEIAATLAYLENELPLRRIESQSQIIALQTDAEDNILHTKVLQEFSLPQNQPNPFNSMTTINYSLAKDSQVRISVYNIIGQVVAVLVDEYQSKGEYSIIWNADDYPSGFYIYRFEADGYDASKKMFLQK